MLQLGLAGLPAGAAQLVQLNAFVFQPEAADHFNIFDRQEELVVAFIYNLQAIMRRAGNGKGDQAFEAADAMLLVHHQLAFGEVGGFGEEHIRFFLFGFCAGNAFAQHVLFAEYQGFVGGKALLQWQHHQADGFALDVAHMPPFIDFDGVEAALHEDGVQAFAGAFGEAGEQRDAILLRSIRARFAQLVEG